MENQEELFSKLREDIRNITRATDMHNVLVNKRSTVLVDLVEMIGTQYASDLLEIGLVNNVGQDKITEYISHFELAIEAEIKDHYTCKGNINTEIFFNEAGNLIKDPLLLQQRVSRLESIKRELIDWQKELKHFLIGSVKQATKIGQVLYIAGPEPFGFIFKMVGVNQFICEKKYFYQMEAMIDLKELPFELRLSNDKIN